MAEGGELARALRAPESELTATLQKVPLTQAGFALGFREITGSAVMGMPGTPGPNGNPFGPNGFPQVPERQEDLADRVLTVPEAAGNFFRFGLMFNAGIRRGGSLVRENVADSVKNIARGAGYPVELVVNPEGNTLEGIYYLDLYQMAAFSSDNSPAAFIKMVESATTEVDDFKLSEDAVAEVLNRYPFARVALDYLTNLRVIYELQRGLPNPTGQVFADPRHEFMQTFVAAIRNGNPVIGRGGGLVIPVIAQDHRVLVEEQVALGYAMFEGLGFRDYFNHKPVTFAGGWYSIDVNANNENPNHFWKGLVADPFSSVRRPYEFVEYVKQRFGVDIAKGLGLEQLDFGWRTHGQNIMVRAITRGVSASQEMLDEFNHYGAGAYSDRFLYPAGTSIRGVPVPPGTPMLKPGTGIGLVPPEYLSKYLPGTEINGVDFSEGEIKVNAVRFWKKMKKASDTLGKLFEGIGDPKKGMGEIIYSAGEYAREAFQEDVSRRQREAIVPQFYHFFNRLAASKGIPVSDEEINRIFQGMKVDLSMYKGIGGWFKNKGDKMKADYYQGVGQANANRLGPKKGETNADQIVAFAKVFYGGK